MSLPTSLRRTQMHWRITSVLLIGAVGVLVVSDPAAALAPPSGGGGGGTEGYKDILTNLYTVAYMTLKWVGLATLVGGTVLWWTSRRNSERAATGMKLVIGGMGMTVLYFGMGSVIDLLEFIAGA